MRKVDRIKLYQDDRWKWHPNEDITLYKKRQKTEREMQKDKEFMQTIENLPKDFFKKDKS